jgi:hypothetical protein
MSGPFKAPIIVSPLLFANRASISATTSSIDHSRLSIPAATVDDVRCVVWMRTKL